MNLAVCGWAIDAGVGRELTDAVANLPISGAFLITHTQKRNRMDLVPEAIRQVSGGLNPTKEMEAFLDKVKPDVILTWEWPGRWEFPELWKAKGIRWVNVVHWDWFPAERLETFKLADLIAPNKVCQEGLEGYGLKSTLLSIPLDVEKFPFRLRTKASRFGMAYGAGGQHGRRSLAEVLDAMQVMQDPPVFTVKAQVKCPDFKLVRNAILKIENSFDPVSVYNDFDVAVQPSKFEGVGISILEAQACGVPVITVDAEPMRTLAPDLLVEAIPGEVSNMKGAALKTWTPDVESLAKVMQGLKGKDIQDLSKRARSYAERYSWKSLRESWKSYLGVS